MVRAVRSASYSSALAVAVRGTAAKNVRRPIGRSTKSNVRSGATKISKMQSAVLVLEVELELAVQMKGKAKAKEKEEEEEEEEAAQIRNAPFVLTRSEIPFHPALTPLTSFAVLVLTECAKQVVLLPIFALSVAARCNQLTRCSRIFANSICGQIGQVMQSCIVLHSQSCSKF